MLQLASTISEAGEHGSTGVLVRKVSEQMKLATIVYSEQPVIFGESQLNQLRL